MKRTFTAEQEESFRLGRISAFEEIRVMCDNTRIKMISHNPPKPNTPRQISNDAKLKSLAVVINNCKQKVEKAKKYQPK